MIGIEKYNAFVHDRLTAKTQKLATTIRRNNLLMISGAKRKRKVAKSYHISSLKTDCSLFSRLYVACQTRNGGLDDFFKHENQSAPPSLSFEGTIRSTTKSSLLECLEPLALSCEVLPDVDIAILDGAVLVNMLRPGTAKTFGLYAVDVFWPYVSYCLKNVDRLDIIWDIYRTDSLKSCTRESRGYGKRKRVTPETVIPGNWRSSLRVDANKTQLFTYLASCIMTIQTEKLIITTQGPVVLSNHPVDESFLSPCSHEEADTRMMVHLADAAKLNKRVLLRTVDTDVVVLAIASVALHPGLKVWISIGKGKDLKAK